MWNKMQYLCTDFDHHYFQTVQFPTVLEECNLATLLTSLEVIDQITCSFL